MRVYQTLNVCSVWYGSTRPSFQSFNLQVGGVLSVEY